jgi:type II secretory ATPase GspE/PulE/Tfp pilus assembly ATPase PilB-like protein
MQDLSFAVSYVSELLNKAISKKASDIHFDPFAQSIRISLRIDGLLHEHTRLAKETYASIVARLKTLAKLDIAQQRLPQDGRFEWQEQHFRLHSCPALFGEKMVARLLPTLKQQLTLDRLGLLPEQLTSLQAALQKGAGLIMVTGPTGSGKTMTLYACLQQLAQQALQIITLEDPVEMALDNVSQIPVRKAYQLSYAELLKAILRQDPDIIMIGEIRDPETAQIAIRAALTGHLVLSTLHTANSKSCVQRLLQMGVTKYHLDDCLHLVVAQRLLRCLCTDCQGRGCNSCKQGYKSRTGVFECLELQAGNETLFSLHDAAMQKCAQGITSEEEARRVL